MQPFRKNVAIAIDGGGIRGVVVARALSILEEHLGKTCHDFCRLTAGTSTGSIIATGIASGLTATRMHELYVQLADVVFPKSWRSILWPLTRHRYPHEPLVKALTDTLGEGPLGDYWSADPPTDVVITMFDLVTQHTRFVKPWKVRGWRRRLVCQPQLPGCLRGTLLSRMGSQRDDPHQPGYRALSSLPFPRQSKRSLGLAVA